MTIMNSMVFVSFLKDIGFSTPPDCQEIKLIVSPDVCRIYFKKQGMGDVTSLYDTIDFNEEITETVKKKLMAQFKDISSYTITCKPDSAVIVDIQYYLGEFDRELIAGILK